MIRFATAAAAACVLVSCALAQNQPDLSALPGVIKSGQWKSIDTSALTQVQRCRLLAVLDVTLDDLAARGRAVADLMSGYIEERGLGAQCIASPPPPDPSALTFGDAKKIAAAMLEGPLAQSPYAAMFTEHTDPLVLRSDEWYYESSCQRKWDEVVETRRQLVWMNTFLQSKDLVAPFKAWAQGEIQRRQQEVAAAAAQRHAADDVKALTQDEAYRARLQERLRQEQQRAQDQAAAAAQMQGAFNTGQMSMGAPAQSVSPQLVTPQANANTAVFPFDTYPAVPYSQDAAYRGLAAAAWTQRYGGWRGGIR